jgi:hypothetical protein
MLQKHRAKKKVCFKNRPRPAVVSRLKINEPFENLAGVLNAAMHRCDVVAACRRLSARIPVVALAHAMSTNMVKGEPIAY